MKNLAIVGGMKIAASQLRTLRLVRTVGAAWACAVFVAQLPAWAGKAEPPVGDVAALRAAWGRFLDVPRDYTFAPSSRLVRTYAFSEFDCELHEQANGPGTTQRVLLTLPKELHGKAPAVVVPYYFPEAMIGRELETGQPLPRYAGRAFMADLARRGFICASADAYHLTYAKSTRGREDFKRWAEASAALNRDWPAWTGIGKLVADTRLVIDLLAADGRVDANRLGILGHSLGGKMAFYTGCLDPRIKEIVASDFGMEWDRTNWEAAWYWGNKLPTAKASGLRHDQLLTLSGGTPFFLIAGESDTIGSFALMDKALGYDGRRNRLAGINHATGHAPPRYALEAAYSFLERYLSSTR